MPIHVHPRPVRMIRRRVRSAWGTTTFYAILTVRAVLAAGLFLALGMVPA